MKTHEADGALQALPDKTDSPASSEPSQSESITKCSAWDTRAKIQVVLCVVGTALFIAAFVAASTVWYRIYVTYQGETLATIIYMGPALLLSFAALCAITATLACAIGTYINIAERSEALKAKCLALSDKKHQSISEAKIAANPRIVCDRGAAGSAVVTPEHTSAEPRLNQGSTNPTAALLHAVDANLGRISDAADMMMLLLDSPAAGTLGPQGTQADAKTIAGVTCIGEVTFSAPKLGMAELVARARPTHTRARSI